MHLHSEVGTFVPVKCKLSLFFQQKLVYYKECSVDAYQFQLHSLVYLHTYHIPHNGRWATWVQLFPLLKENPLFLFLK